MNNYFSHTEFIIRPDLPVSDRIIRNIYIYHINPMNGIRDRLGMPIIVSKKSGFRPVEYELAKGRSGESEHTFREDISGSKGLGAADYTCERNDILLRLLVSHTDYTRIAYYGSFIHCDYKFPEQGQRVFNSEWEVKTVTELLGNK